MKNKATETMKAMSKMNYEYKSGRTLFGLPLVHVNLSRKKMVRAKGVITVGNVATGLVSVGLFAVGLLSVGIAAAGLLSVAILSLGLLWAIGIVAIGIFALGIVAIGLYSLGVCAVASQVAIGRFAYGHVAIGKVAEGARTILDTSPKSNFAGITPEQARGVTLEELPGTWNWIVNALASVFKR